MMFFLVFAGAVTPDRRVVSFPTGVVQPLFKTVIPRAHRGLQLLASTWLRDAGHNAWLHMINECHLERLCHMVFLACPIGSLSSSKGRTQPPPYRGWWLENPLLGRIHGHPSQVSTHRDHRNSFKGVSIATSKGREGDEQQWQTGPAGTA